MATRSKPPETLVCWHSQGHGIEPLRDTLRLLQGRGHAIDRVLYLLQKPTEQSAVQSINGSIKITPTLIELRDPTAHREIYTKLKEQLLPQLHDLGGPLHVNVSPGTPAMHTVWLLLHSAGDLPDGTLLWSSQKPKDGPSRISAVDFPITTYLAEVRRSAAARPQQAQFDPESHSQARRDALNQLALYARLRGAPLLLLGERGTGKSRLCETLVADLKGRSKVVTVPCGTLDPALAMSLLFGHVKGAFTGADRDQPGYLDEAKGGILFLDEIQDLHKPVQRQLVRFLQDPERKYRPVRGQKELRGDVEVVCASHLSLRELRERLDDDLFDRLSLLLVEIPPLRQCRDDLKDDFFRVWRELRRQQEFTADPPWSRGIEEALCSDPLAGNLRDLQRLVLLIMAHRGSTATSFAIEPALSAFRALQSKIQEIDASSQDLLLQDGDTWDSASIRAHRRIANEAKARFGTAQKAAQALGVSDRTLRKYSRSD